MGRVIADEGRSTLALLAGAVSVLFGALKLGRLAPFCSESVLMGFVFGLAPVIAIKPLVSCAEAIVPAQTFTRQYGYRVDADRELVGLGADALAKVAQELEQRGVRLLLARVHAQVRETLARGGVTARIGKRHIYRRTFAAAMAFVAGLVGELASEVVGA